MMPKSLAINKNNLHLKLILQKVLNLKDFLKNKNFQSSQRVTVCFRTTITIKTQIAMTIKMTTMEMTLTTETPIALQEDVKLVSITPVLNANWINMVRRNTFSSMEDVMNPITIRMMIDMKSIQMKNGMIIKITMNKVKFLMVVESTNAKQVVKFVMAQLILQNVQLVWMDLLLILQLLNA